MTTGYSLQSTVSPYYAAFFYYAPHASDAATLVGTPTVRPYLHGFYVLYSYTPTVHGKQRVNVERGRWGERACSSTPCPSGVRRHGLHTMPGRASSDARRERITVASPSGHRRWSGPPPEHRCLRRGKEAPLGGGLRRRAQKAAFMPTATMKTPRRVMQRLPSSSSCAARDLSWGGGGGGSGVGSG